MTFDQFFTKLKENDIWFDQLPLTYPNRNMTMVARQLHSWLLAMEYKMDDWKQIRSMYQKFLWQAGETFEQPKPDKAEPVEIHPQALTGEARDKWLKEWDEAVKKADDSLIVPHQKSSVRFGFEGTYEFKPHPSSSPEYAYILERHNAWLKHRFDALTKAVKTGSMTEQEFNKQYDEGLI